MVLFATNLLAPAAIHPSLVTLPRGRPALTGILAALLTPCIARVFLAGPADDSLPAAAIAIVAAAAVLAALAQGLRALPGPGRPCRPCPATVVLAFPGDGRPAPSVPGH